MIPYSEFEKLVRADKVARVVVSEKEIEGAYKEEIDGKKRFVTTRIDQDLARESRQDGILAS